MRRTRILLAAAVVATTLASSLFAVSRNDKAEAAVVWNEEFNGGAGTGVDGSKWNFDTGGSGNHIHWRGDLPSRNTHGFDRIFIEYSFRNPRCYGFKQPVPLSRSDCNY